MKYVARKCEPSSITRPTMSCDVRKPLYFVFLNRARTPVLGGTELERETYRVQAQLVTLLVHFNIGSLLKCLLLFCRYNLVPYLVEIHV